jgi:protein dithiol oxidoreductase (disulfide-forming)
MYRHLLLWVFISMIVAGCASPQAEPQNRRKGDGFSYLSYNHKTSDPSKTEILVFFGYQCPHCYRTYKEEFSARIATHSFAEKIKLVPVIWIPSVVPSTRAFYVAEVLGKNPEFHSKLFSAFQSRSVDLSSESALEDFAEKCCAINRAQFKSIYKSSEVDGLLARDESYVREYNIAETPSVVVNGKYYISPTTMPRGAHFGEFIDSLIQKDAGK